MNDTKYISGGAARYSNLPKMELLMRYAKELGKEISDEDFAYALYQMYCG